MTDSSGDNLEGYGDNNPLSMDFGTTISDFCHIGVSIIPIQPIPNEVFERYASMIEGFSEISLSHVNRAPSTGVSVLPHIDWIEGRICFSYTREIRTVSHPYEDMYACKRTWAVIGIAHCASAGINLRDAAEDFIKKQNSEMNIVRVLGFEPEEDQPDDPLKNFAMIPSAADEARLAFYVHTLLADMAADILTFIEDSIIASQYISGELELSVHGDDMKQTAQWRKEGDVRKGRNAKWAGDLCILSSTPIDALPHYERSLSLLRAGGDHVWAAAAREGIATAKLLSNSAVFSVLLNGEHESTARKLPSALKDLVSSPSGDKSGAHDESNGESKELGVEGLCGGYADVVSELMKRKAWICAAECALRLSHLRASIGGSRQKELVRDVLQMAEEAVMELERGEKSDMGVLLRITAAKIWESVDCRRQLGRVLWGTAQSLSGVLACKLRTLAGVKAYGVLPLREPKLPSLGFHLPKPGVPSLSSTEKCTWKSIERDILVTLMEDAAHQGAFRAACQLALCVLSQYYEITTPREQSGLQDFLKSVSCQCSRAESLAYKWYPLPLVRDVELCRLSSSREPCIIEENEVISPSSINVEEAKQPIFIYTPFGNEASDEQATEVMVNWVIGEPAHIAINMCNPFSFNVSVRSVSVVWSDGSEWRCCICAPSVTPLVLLPYSMSAHIDAAVVVPFDCPTGERVVTDVRLGLDDIIPWRVTMDLPISESIGGKKQVFISPSLPFLHLDLVNPDDVSVEVLDGQEVNIHMRLVNAGSLPIEWISRVSTSDDSNCDDTALFLFDEADAKVDVITSDSPLEVGSQLEIAVKIFGVCREKVVVRRSSFSWEYGMNGSTAHRTAFVKLAVRVMPSVCIDSVDVLEREHGMIAVEVSNRSRLAFQIRLSEGETAVLDPECTKCVYVRIPDMDSLETPEYVRRMLLKVLQMRWKSTCDTYGTVRVPLSVITQEVVDALKPPPLVLQASCDGVEPVKGNSYMVEVGERFGLTVTISPCDGAADMKDLRIRISIDPSIMRHGSLSFEHAILTQGEKICHSVGLCCTRAGVFDCHMSVFNRDSCSVPVVEEVVTIQACVQFPFSPM